VGKKSSSKTKNLLHAFLLTVGIYGSIHLISSLVIAVYRGNGAELNPYYIIHVDRTMGHLAHTKLTIAIGWIVWLATIIFFYKKFQNN
jgi:hypothetical protein